MVRVKICGITRVEDAIAAAHAGADAIGLVFAKSPRRVTISEARKIVESLPPFVAAVGVFVNESPQRVRRIAVDVGLSFVQLHGDEPLREVTAMKSLRVIKAIRVRDTSFVNAVQSYLYAGAAAVLLDAHDPAQYGGTGRIIDWRAVARDLRKLKDQSAAIILAGGLTPHNVAEAIQIVRPWAVDVSSGVETRLGIKSAARIRTFITKARRR